MIAASAIAKAFEEIIGWPYVSPGTNDQNGIDCSGAFVRAYKKHGLAIAHGSNTIYRKHCTETGRILGDASRLLVGMAVFKQREDGGEPSKYQGDGIGNMYHIGLVTGVNPLRIVHATPPAARADTKLGNWGYYGRLIHVEFETAGAYETAEEPDEVDAVEEMAGEEDDTGEAQTVRNGTAMVWAAGGQPVKLRSTPGTEKPYLAKVPVGTMVTVYATAMNSSGQEWSSVSVGGKRGFMMSQFLLGVSG